MSIIEYTSINKGTLRGWLRTARHWRLKGDREEALYWMAKVARARALFAEWAE